MPIKDDQNGESGFIGPVSRREPRIRLNGPQMKAFREISEERALSKGQCLPTTGGIVYILKNGSARLSKAPVHGGHRRLRSAEVGEIIGLTETIAGIADIAGDLCILADSDCVVIEVPGRRFIDLISKDADLCFDLVLQMARQLAGKHGPH